MTSAPDRPLTDTALLDLVQRQTFRYFWDHAHPQSGMTRDRINAEDGSGDDVIATGGSGFGVMAIIVAVERGWIERAQAVHRLASMLDFLTQAETYCGIYPHFIDGASGKALTLWADDEGSDIVETSFLLMGFLCARQYFDSDDGGEPALREAIDRLWHQAEWRGHLQNEQNALCWHRKGADHSHCLFHEIRGWNECLITYVLAASSPTHPIAPETYHRGWAGGEHFRNGRNYYGIRLPLGPDLGGPLFFAHYSFLGLDPRGLRDRYADYWEQNCHHTLINYEYCVRNPHGYRGYGEACWGLTASDSDDGYCAHAPDNDRGVITPTAAISSMPYTPEHSMRALRHFYHDKGEQLWRRCGFVDAFNDTTGWRANSHLAIDQGPIIGMIENFRSGLLWRLFMSCPEVRHGLAILGFEWTPPS